MNLTSYQAKTCFLLILTYSWTAELVLGPPDYYPQAGWYPEGHLWSSAGAYPEYLEVSVQRYWHPTLNLHKGAGK